MMEIARTDSSVVAGGSTELLSLLPLFLLLYLLLFLFLNLFLYSSSVSYSYSCILFLRLYACRMSPHPGISN